MSVNPLTHLSNTICYIDKPTQAQAEKTRLEQANKVNDAGLDAAGGAAREGKLRADPAGRVEPGPSINGSGQALGRIVNVTA